jgi:murein DD-endopeptidase MepM/ murein hydrolase activator NlpD
MAKAQFPIDGKLGKDFKVTSYMGWRIHPVEKTKKHHNGTDIWSPHEPCWIEAPYDGVVVAAVRKNTGFGNHVMIRHKINGQQYVTVFAHMIDGSLKVKKGQKVTAGTPLGKMGSTGMSTGKHLHWELYKGKTYTWSANGKNFIEPIAFFKALIEHEKAIASAPVETPADAPVAPAPTHDEAGAKAVETVVATPAAPVAPAPAAPTPAAKPAYPGKYIKLGSKGTAVKYIQKQLGLPQDGVFGTATANAVKALQKKHKLTADGIVGPKTWAALG